MQQLNALSIEDLQNSQENCNQKLRNNLHPRGVNFF